MARFEVFIPAATPDDLNMTLRVTADTWMAALKVGLKKIGDASGLPQNVLCDIQDDESIHVTDPRNNRVFRIAQIPEISNPGVGVVLPTPSWMAAPSDPPPADTDPELQAVAKVALERAALEKAALDRAAQERAAAQRAAQEKAAAERFAAEKAAAERAAAQAAAEERALAEKAAAENAVAEANAALARAQAEKAAAESRAAKEAGARAVAKALEEKAAAEKANAERAAAEKAAAQKAAAGKAAASRLAAEKAAAEAKAAEKAAKEKLAAEKAAEEKAAREKAAAEKASAEKRSADKAVHAKLHAPIPVKIVEVDNQRSPPPAVIGRLAQTAHEGPRVEEILSELFERTPEMFGKSPEDALYFLLDLAMEKIPCESGTFYKADLNRRDLGFAAVRGPKAAELLALKLRVPMGKGFVGFCAQEGVAVAISDAQRDKRFYKEISQRLGYDTSSMITTPVIHDNRTLGAIQLINKTGSTSFSSSDLSILHYLAHQAALYLEAKEI